MTTISRVIFMALSVLFVLFVLIQIYIAGMAVFMDPSYWHNHVVFVRIFELFPILMLIFSFLGKLPKFLRWMSVFIFTLIFIQYITANFDGAGAFHPVIAAVLLWVSIVVMKHAGRSMSESSKSTIIQTKGVENQ